MYTIEFAYYELIKKGRKEAVSYKFQIFYHNTLSVVDCGQPGAPQHGSLESYTNTTEGSEVFYSCDPGLVPVGRMRAACTRNGWSPNPADLSCVGGL